MIDRDFSIDSLDQLNTIKSNCKNVNVKCVKEKLTKVTQNEKEWCQVEQFSLNDLMPVPFYSGPVSINMLKDLKLLETKCSESLSKRTLEKPNKHRSLLLCNATTPKSNIKELNLKNIKTVKSVASLKAANNQQKNSENFNKITNKKSISIEESNYRKNLESLKRREQYGQNANLRNCSKKSENKLKQQRNAYEEQVLQKMLSSCTISTVKRDGCHSKCKDKYESPIQSKNNVNVKLVKSDTYIVYNND